MAKWIADLLLLGVITFVGYSILIGFERKQIANLVIMVAVMMGPLTTMQDLAPVIRDWGNRVTSLQDTADKIANLGRGSWAMPMKGELSQSYKGSDHHGIDIASPIGTPVMATKQGDVKEVGWSDIYGNMIIVDHGGGLESLYCHLSGIDVKVGYPVYAGQRIGSCGNTGNSTGPHLHFEIRKNGTSVDPASYFK